MRGTAVMKPTLALMFVLLPLVPAAAAPVHISLKASAVLMPDRSDFFCLGSVATLSGGTDALRTRLAAVTVGRDPLPGDVRHLTPGDLVLKMRQAGFHPSQDVVIDGATEADVTVSGLPVSNSIPAANSGGTGNTPTPNDDETRVIHPGDPVTIRVDDGSITVTASGIAETGGAVGDEIRIRREGAAAELDATVLDAQTVELEF
jgi:hypothetical protein